MKSGIRATIFVAFLLLVTSCTYEFSEDYFNDIENHEPDVNISLTGFTNGEDTRSSKMVGYNFTGVGSTDFEVLVKVDEKEIHWGHEKSGEFLLPIDELKDGNHTLSFQFAFPINSGSLAGAIGGEYYTGTAVYDFSIDRSLANSFGIAAVKIVEGSIYIDLNPVTDNNFNEAYLLIRNENGYVLEERLISQEELANGKIHDDETIIYNPAYAVKVKNEFTENVSDFVVLPTSKMEFSTAVLGYESFKLIYSGHPLYANLDKIQFDYTYRYSGSSLHNIDPKGGETVINYGYFFGEIFSVNLMIFRDDAIIGNLQEHIHIGNIFPVSGFEGITYVPSVDKYFILDINPEQELVIHQLNSESFEVEKTKTLIFLDHRGDLRSFEIDPVTTGLIINMSRKAIVFDPLSFSVTGTYNASDYNPSKPNADVYYRGEYIILDDPWSSGEVGIYEKTTGGKRFSINRVTRFFSAVDAGFFYVNGDLYKLQAGNFVVVGKIQDSENNMEAPPLHFMVFDKRSNSTVFGWYRQTYYLDLTSSRQTVIRGPDDVHEVSYTEDGKPFINSSHFSAGMRSHIYDADANETRFIDTAGYQSYRYFNGFIFSPTGFYLESDLYKN